jgi:hypothetical protein
MAHWWNTMPQYSALFDHHGRNSRVVQLDSAAPVNNIRVVHFGRSEDLGNVPLKLKPWDIRWIEIE